MEDSETSQQPVITTDVRLHPVDIRPSKETLNAVGTVVKDVLRRSDLQPIDERLGVKMVGRADLLGMMPWLRAKNFNIAILPTECRVLRGTKGDPVLVDGLDLSDLDLGELFMEHVVFGEVIDVAGYAAHAVPERTTDISCLDLRRVTMDVNARTVHFYCKGVPRADSAVMRCVADDQYRLAMRCSDNSLRTDLAPLGRKIG